jgi:hypothetical protein
MLRPMSRLTSDASCGTSVVNPGTLSSANLSKTRPQRRSLDRSRSHWWSSSDYCKNTPVRGFGFT